MTCINLQIIAARLRVAKNFNLLIEAGICSNIAAAIVSRFKNIAFSEIRVDDERIVLCYRTCKTTMSIDYKIVA